MFVILLLCWCFCTNAIFTAKHFWFRYWIHVKTGFANPDSGSHTEWTDLLNPIRILIRQIEYGLNYTETSHNKQPMSCEAQLTSQLWSFSTITYKPSKLGQTSWWCGTVVERRSSAGELSLSCAQPASDEWPVICVTRPLQVSQLGQLSLSSFWGR